jgi:glutamate-1-semialdehyde 2,1-aminomutase
VEPVAGNMGVIPPVDDFLPGLRALTEQHGALLILDEVMTGFRVGPHGAQGLYEVTPDLTTLGKVIGGGLPVGAYGGKRQVMEMIAPSGPVYQAGTLSGNPLAMTAGIATLKALKDPEAWDKMNAAADELAEGIFQAARAGEVPIQQTRAGTMFATFFVDEMPYDWSTVKKSDTQRFGRFFQAMLEQGVYLAPSQFEAGFISTEHRGEVIEATVRAAREAFKKI